MKYQASKIIKNTPEVKETEKDVIDYWSSLVHCGELTGREAIRSIAYDLKKTKK
jgi:hypothetical protein